LSVIFFPGLAAAVYEMGLVMGLAFMLSEPIFLPPSYISILHEGGTAQHSTA
jgi:hypothetical protein